MAERHVRVWYDPEGDYLEVLFDQQDGFYRPTGDDRIMEKVDAQGTVFGFSILGLSTIKGSAPLQVALPSGADLSAPYAL
ncbi:MAG: DUF2283 domain-containing protein [Dehalococcoidia bacterium]